MAFLKALTKANEVKKVLDELEIAKINAKRAREGLPPLELEGYCDCLFYPFRWLRAQVCPCVCIPGTLPTPTFCWKRMWFEGTYANKITKQIFGFLAGVMISLSLLYLLLVEFEVDLTPGIISAAIISTILPFGLAFSSRIRCVTMLVVPSMFTDKGQALLLAYMLVVVANGPIENFNYNTQVLATSALCAQQQLIKSSGDLINYLQRPLLAIAEKTQQMMKEMEKLAEKMEDKIEALAANFQNIADEFERVKRWYDRVANFCNRRHSDIEGFCDTAATQAKEQCKVKYPMNLVLKSVCRATMKTIKKTSCKAFNGIKNKMCEIDIDIDIDIDLGIRKKLNETIERRKQEVREFFYFNISYYRNTSLHEIKSTNYTAILNNIKSELYNRVQLVIKIIEITQWTLFIFSTMVVIMAVYYLYRYHHKLHFDNCYIDQFIMEVDGKRMALHEDKESIFPLTWKEELTYIKPTSIRITKSELLKTIANILILLPVLVHILLVSLCDIGLWWVLELVKRIFLVDYAEEIPGTFTTTVEGDGALADTYRKMLSMAESVNTKIDTSAWECLPSPQEPQWDKYATIRNLVIYMVIVAMLQAYILRLRHMICSWVYPKQARERAVYLYNEILQLRGSFSTYVRRQIQRSTDEQANIEQVSLCHRIGAGAPWLRPVLNALGYAQKYCLSCGLAGGAKDLENFVHCQNYGCRGVYCRACIEDINNLCTACMKPVEYGDLSDVDEERDSSSDEEGFDDKRFKAQTSDDDKTKNLQRQADVMRKMFHRLQNQKLGLPPPEESSTDTESEEGSQSITEEEGDTSGDGTVTEEADRENTSGDELKSVDVQRAD